jgi:hypothetical protein
LRIVYYYYYNYLKARALIIIKLSLHFSCKCYFASNIDLLISYIVAYSLVKNVFKQADVYKHLLKVYKPEAEEEEAIVILQID